MILYFRISKFNIRFRYFERDWNHGRFVVFEWYYQLGKRQRGIELLFDRLGGRQAWIELVRTKNDRKFGLSMQAPIHYTRYQ